MPRKSKSMGALGLGTDMTILILGGGAVAIYFVGKNIGLWGSGTSSGASSTAATPSGNTSPASAPTDIQTFLAQGQTPGYSQSQYASFADTIYNAGNTAFSFMSSPATVLAVLDQMNDPIDIAELIQAFGTRSIQGLWSADLYQFINKAFSTSDIASFNQQLQYNGITQYQF